MKVGPYQTIRLIYDYQLRGKVLPMPEGEQSTCYLVEIIEEGSTQHGKSNIGCKVIVPKDKIFKYSKKDDDEKVEMQVIFDISEVLAQYQDVKDLHEFCLYAYDDPCWGAEASKQSKEDESD